jgi:hypothetical protein
MPTDVSVPNLRQLRDQMQDILAPLQKQAEVVDAAIAEKQTELEELRAVKRDITRLLNAANPGAKPGPRKQRRNSNGRDSNGRYPVSEEKIEETLSFVKANLHGQPTFKGPDIFNHPKWTGASSATVAKVLDTLSDRGVLRLDHIDKDRSKNFALVSRG